MLKVEKLTKVYNDDFISRILRRKKIRAVDDVSFEVDKGEIFGILGPNGAGKTTIIKAICGLILPTQGDIKVNSFSVVKTRQKVLAKIGVTLEGSRNIYYRLTVRENLRYFGNLKHVFSKKLTQRTDFLIDYFDLREKQNELAMKLSSGMKQKLTIAIALIGDPDILLLDDFGSGIDIQTIDMLERLIKQIAENFKKTIIVASHQLDIIERICNRISIIDKGKIVITDYVRHLKELLPTQVYEIIFQDKKAKFDKSLRENLYKIINIQHESRDKENIRILTTISNPEMLYEIMLFLKHNDMGLISISQLKKDLHQIFLDSLKK